MSENQKIKSVHYAKSSLPLKISNEWLNKYLTIYCEKIRNKASYANALQYGVTDKNMLKNVPEMTEPVIDFNLFERIRFIDGMPRVLVAIFGVMVGDTQAIFNAF
jgi:hypothetical protein